MEENNNLNIYSESKTIKFKKKRTLFFTGAFILLIIITIFLLFFKNDLFKKEVKKENIVKEEEKSKTDDELLVEELLISGIPYIWTSDVNSKLYNSSLITFDNLNQEGLMGIIIHSLASSDYLSYDETNIEESKITGDLEANLASNLMHDASMVIPMKDIIKIIKDRYNLEDYSVDNYNEIKKYEKYSEFNITGGMGYIYDDYLFLMYGKGAMNYQKNTVSYTFEKTNNELYVYEKMFIIEYGLYSGNTDCYINQIDSKVKSILYNETLTDDELEKESMDACSPYAKTFKHVFKLNDSGEYYWYSTEPYEA